MATATVPRGTKTNGAKPPAPGAEARAEIVLQIPLERIDIGANVRVNVAEIDELAASIAEHGVLQPIKVRDGAGDKYLVTWGQRRVLAARKAGLTRIPALVGEADVVPEALATEQLVENLHRADLNPIDRARAMRQVVDSGLSQAALAAKLGIGASTVANDLAFLEAPAKVQAALEQGRITPAHAKAVKGLPSAKQVELVERAVKVAWSAHDLEREAKWAREQHTREERDRGRLDKIGASAVAQLEKAVAKDALIVVTGTVVANAIKKAGWTNIHGGDRWAVDVVQKAGECGCATWFVDYDIYGNGGAKVEAKLKPACADAGHRDARAAATRQERDKEFAERQAKQEALAKSRAKDAKAIQKGIRSEIDTLAPTLARALLWMLADDYQQVIALQGRHGGSTTSHEPAKVWPLIEGLTDDAVLDELAIAVASKATPDSWRAENAAGVRAALLELVAAS